jgi:hypothetical protein
MRTNEYRTNGFRLINRTLLSIRSGIAMQKGTYDTIGPELFRLTTISAAPEKKRIAMKAAKKYSVCERSNGD